MSTQFYPLTDIWVLSYTSPDAHPGTILVTKPAPVNDNTVVVATSLVVPTSGVYGLRLRNATETVRLYLGEYLADVPANSLHVDLPTTPVTLALATTLDVPAAYLLPTIGTVTTPDPGPLPAEHVWVVKTRGSSVRGTFASQYGAAADSCFFLGRWPDGLMELGTSPTGSTTTIPYWSLGTNVPTGGDEWLAMSRHDNGTQASARTWRSTNGGVTWTQVTLGGNVASQPIFDSTAPVVIGAGGGGTWNDRIYSVELRTGTDPAVGGNTLAVPGHIYFPGTASNYATTPNAAPQNILGDICIVARIAPDDWTPAGLQTVVSKWNIVQQYLLYLQTNGSLFFFWTASGGAQFSAQSTAAVSAADGAWKWIAVTMDVDNGATGRSVRFWTSDDNVTWTQLGTTVTVAGITSIQTGTSALEIGTVGGANMFKGKLGHLSIRDGIGAGGVVGGTEVFRYDAMDLPPTILPTATSFVTGTGQTVSVVRSAGDPKTTIVPTTAGVVWKFDANDYPGSGTSYVDPRGRTWTLTNTAAVTPQSVAEITGSYSLDGQSWTSLEQKPIMVEPPTHADLYFDQFSTVDSISASFQNFRVLPGTLALPYLAKHIFFNPIGGDDAVQPPALTPSQEAVIHALVGAQFGDLEFDIGKSVRWTQYFADDVFITDVNYGDPRYWIIDWAQTFPYVNYKTAGGGVSFFDDPVTFRKTQFADAEQFARDNEEALVFDNNDWVLWVDAHEGLSVDNTPPFPDDYDFDLFRSYVAREIRIAIEAGKDRIILPFYVYVRHDHIQNVEYDWIPNQADGGNKCVQSMGVPYYIPYQGLLRLMKVSVLRNPAFDWSSIDQPVALALDEGVEEPHLKPAALGWLTTPHATDLTITTDTRFIAKIRDDSTESTASRIVAGKAHASTTPISWRFGVTYAAGFNISGFPTGAPAPQVIVHAVNRSALGLTPPGQDRYVGSILTGIRSDSTALTLRGQAIESTDGVTWTNEGALGTAVAANTMSSVTASPLNIGQVWQGRIYWAQMEKINQRRLVYPGSVANYLTTPGAPFDALNGKITFIFQVASDDWTLTYQALIARRGADPLNSFDVVLRGAADRIPALSIYVYSDGTVANRWSVFSTSFPVAGVDGQPMWMAVTYEHDNGASGRTARFFHSTDGVTWTIVGTAQTAAGVFPAKVGIATPVQVGITAGSFPFKGRFMRAIVNNGVGAAGVPGGTPVFDLRENDATGWTTGTFPSSSPRYVSLPGIAGNYLTAPDAPNFDVTDLTIVAKVRLPDWTPASIPASHIVGKWATAGNNRGFTLDIINSGNLRLAWSADGGTVTGVCNSTLIVPAADGTWKWVALTFDVNDGAGNNVARFWTGDDGVNWTQLGTAVTTAGATSIWPNSALLEIGTHSGGTLNPFLGGIAHVSIRNGIGAAGVVGGTEVFRLDAADLTYASPSATSFTVTTGQTVTVNRSGSPQTEIVSALMTPTGSVVQTAPDEVVWRFDAKDYPGTGTSYVDPRGRTWTLGTDAVLAPYDQPEVRLQVVSYGYAHWNLQDIPPGANGVPTLNAENDLGWRQRNLLSKMRPVPGLPYGDTWQFPNADTPGLAGPWAPDTFENQVTGVVIPEARPPIDPLVASVRVPLYDSVLRLNTRDGVWYSGDGSGNVPLEWDEESQSWKPPVTQEQQVT